MATYHAAHLGGATTYADATGAAYPANYLPMSAVNAGKGSGDGAVVLAAGDTMILSAAGGNFTTALTPKVGGTVGSVVTYLGDVGSPPTIVPTSGSAFDFKVSNLVGGSVGYVTLSGVTLQTVSDNPINIEGAPTNLTIEDVDLGVTSPTAAVYIYDGFTNLTLRNLSVTALTSLTYSIYVRGAGTRAGITVDGLTTDAGVIRLIGASNVTLRNLDLTGAAGSSYGAVYLQGCTGTLTIDGTNYIETTDTDGVKIDTASVAAGSVISNIEIGAAGKAGFNIASQAGSAGTPIVIKDCSVSAAVTQGISFTDCSYVSVQNLTVFPSAAGATAGQQAALVGASCHHIDFIKCSGLGVGGDGFAVTGGAGTPAHDILFKSCNVVGCGDRTTTITGDGITAHDNDYNITVDDCLIMGNACSGVAFISRTAGVVKNSVILNNAGDWSATGGSGLDQVRGGVWITTTDVNATSGAGWTVSNNTIYGNYPFELNVAAASPVVIDNNRYVEQFASSFASANGGSTPLDFANWQTAGYDLHSEYAALGGKGVIDMIGRLRQAVMR